MEQNCASTTNLRLLSYHNETKAACNIRKMVWCGLQEHFIFTFRYTNNKSSPFELDSELRAYCENDTEILIKSVLEFRRILMQEVTQGFDVLPISCTIARFFLNNYIKYCFSACMSIFRALFMKENQLALVPERGYERNEKASVVVIKFCFNLK